MNSRVSPHAAIRSDEESSRFGIPIFRSSLSGESDLAAALNGSLRGLPDEAMLLVSLTLQRSSVSPKVETLSGRRVFWCSPSIDWSATRSPHHNQAYSPPCVLLEALHREESKEMAAELVRLSFQGYHSHYLDDPILRPRVDMADAYAQWVSREIDQGQAEIFVIRDSDEVASFLVAKSVSLTAKRVLLAATVPSYRSRGNYSRLLRAYLDDQWRQGIDSIHITTQASNIQVQRRWASLGLVPTSYIEHVHIWPVGVA